MKLCAWGERGMQLGFTTDPISTNTKMMWKDGGNSEELHSSNASLRWVTVFSECSNTAWAYNPIFYISKVCLCTTNCHLYHKDPCPERGLNHSKVVIRKQWRSKNKRSQTADVPPAHDGTDGTSGYLIPKTSRSLSDSTASREQKRKVILSEQGF